MVNSGISRYLTVAKSYWLWFAVIAVGAVVFFGAPGAYDGTSYALLHGLCAQTPSHTITFGDRMLPFDSRMTGIYGGFLVSIAVLAWRGRVFHYGNPSRIVIAVMGLLVGAMAIDGFNSLLTDLGVWHPYVSTNAMRVTTGYGVGVVLAISLCWLLASSVWNMSSPDPSIRGVRDLAVPAIGLVAFGALLWISPAVLHLPVSILMVISAWLTVSLLMLVIVLLTLKLDANVRNLRSLHVPGAISALLAVSVMIGLAAARYWVEHRFGITNAMM